MTTPQAPPPGVERDDNDWTICFHSSGNEPGCAACWHGAYLRAHVDVVSLSREVAHLRALRDAVRSMVGDGHPSGYGAPDEWFKIMVRRLQATEQSDEPSAHSGGDRG